MKTLFVARPRQTQRDHIDRWLEEMRGELPASVDFEVEGVVDRIAGIQWRVKKMLEETLDDLGLSHSDWKVLSSLRWAGAPYRRSAGELAKRAELSSGAMTARLDQLEGEGLVKRLRDPDDRRGVLVELTAKGRKAHEAAIGVQAEKENLLKDALTKRELEQLNALLRRIMLTLEERYPKS